MRNACKTGGSVKKKMATGGVIVASPISGPRRKVAGSNMAQGGSLKSVNSSANPGLAKLPTPVRNKMGYAKKGGTKKYQDGGVMGQVKGITKAIANKTRPVSNMKDVANATDQMKVERLRRMGKTTSLGTDSGPKIDYLGRGKGSTDWRDERYYGMSIPEAARIAVKAGEQKKKFTRAAHPSDVIGQKPTYLKKKGGQAHPGFKAVQAKIAAKSGVSKQAAGAILAASTRNASAKAKAANPKLKRVKG